MLRSPHYRVTPRLRALAAAGLAAATLSTLGIGTPAADAAPIVVSVPQSAIDDRYAAEGGASGWLGPATGAQRAVAGGAAQDFRNGSIYYSPATGARIIYGSIRDRYNALPQSIKDSLGLPTSEEIAGPAGAGRQSIFTGGRIVWSLPTGAQAIYGAIAHRYNDTSIHSHLGLPVAEEAAGPSGSRQVRFQKGVIQWRADAQPAKAVYGAVYDKYRAYENQFGMARTDELAGSRNSRISHFEGGTVVWSGPTGANVVYGSIREKWNAKGADRGFLGLPTSDEFSGQRGSRVNRFTGGLVIWTPRTGAYEVHGALLDEYARQGWEGGPLGAPTSDEFTISGGWGQDFENGRLTLVNGRGFQRENFLRPSVRVATAGDVRSTWRSGCPVGPDQLRVIDINHIRYDNTIGRGQIIVRSDMTDRVIDAFRDGANGNFPIDKIINPNVYGADDPAMMRDNNTSAFNCRAVVGNPYAMSPHSYGRALDVNPRQNPYLDSRGKWWPENGLLWRDRNRSDPGMLRSNGPLVRGLTSRGFFWGANWSNPDYHHFEYRGAGARSTQAAGTPSLDPAALPGEILGFRASVVPPTEHEFVPNGTPFHAVDAPEVSRTVVPTCTPVAEDLPRATAGVAGTYRDDSGRTGNALALRFADAESAQRWFSAYAGQVEGCAAGGSDEIEITDLTANDDHFAAQRYQVADRSDWGELGRVAGDTVVLATLSGDDHAGETLLTAADQL